MHFLLRNGACKAAFVSEIFKCLDSRIMWVKLKLDRENVVALNVYAPGMGKRKMKGRDFGQDLANV